MWKDALRVSLTQVVVSNANDFREIAEMPWRWSFSLKNASHKCIERVAYTAFLLSANFLTIWSNLRPIYLGCVFPSNKLNNFFKLLICIKCSDHIQIILGSMHPDDGFFLSCNSFSLSCFHNVLKINCKSAFLRKHPK